MKKDVELETRKQILDLLEQFDKNEAAINKNLTKLKAVKISELVRAFAVVDRYVGILEACDIRFRENNEILKKLSKVTREKLPQVDD